jgi:hypothetical protein
MLWMQLLCRRCHPCRFEVVLYVLYQYVHGFNSSSVWHAFVRFDLGLLVSYAPTAIALVKMFVTL